jgi:hypothetical protein
MENQRAKAKIQQGNLVYLGLLNQDFSVLDVEYRYNFEDKKKFKKISEGYNDVIGWEDDVPLTICKVSKVVSPYAWRNQTELKINWRDSKNLSY